MAKKISVNVYDDLRQSLADALVYERGEQVDLRVTEMPAPPKRLKPREIRSIRERLHASQARFAAFICVSAKAVQSWEQGTRRPQNTALRLLNIAKHNPMVLLGGAQAATRVAAKRKDSPQSRHTSSGVVNVHWKRGSGR